MYYHYIINNASLTEIFEPKASFLESFRKRALEITLFDLPDHGGEAIILRHKEKAILVDGGEGGKREHEELGEKLRDAIKGKAKLEAIVLSHNHQDHSNAIGSMLKGDRTILHSKIKFYHQNEPRTSIFLEKMWDQLDKKKIDDVKINEWEDISLPSWKGKLPIKLFCGPKISGESDRLYRSILMRFPFGSATFLFTGDILEQSTTKEIKIKKDIMKRSGKYTELQLISSYKTKHLLKNIDVLKITHHGSHTGTSTEFLDHTSPFLFFTSSTDHEKHNLSKAVKCRIQKYVDRNDEKFNVGYYPIFNTHWEGDLIVRTDGIKRTMDGTRGILFEVETER